MTLQKRKRDLDDDEPQLEALWQDIDQLNKDFVPFRNQTIEKWNQKVQVASGIPLQKKFKVVNQVSFWLRCYLPKRLCYHKFSKS